MMSDFPVRDRAGHPAPARRRDSDSRRYWDAVAAAASIIDSPLWRDQSDLVNAALIDRWLPAPAGRVLKTDLFDEVVAPGLFPALRERASEVVGVDISPAIVSAASSRYPDLECLPGDVLDLPFEDACFDAVVSNSTLDHLSDATQVCVALAELRRVLRPGGRLVLTLDNRSNPLIFLRDALPTRMARAVRGVPYDSGWTCGPRRLRRLLVGARFEPREATAVLHLPRVLVAKLGDDRLGRRERWRSAVRACERLESLPTRYLTGHFVASLSVRPAHRGALGRR